MKYELLAPAGNLKIFYAVINAGANAVYVGGPKFGARAYAKNFTTEELLEAISYAHLHNVKVYMTVNTLVKEEEVSDCIQMMIPFYEAGLDGVIVQDIGILHLFRQHFPGMELHASTQMSISNTHGVELLKKAGVVRVVPSRELSLAEIKRIHEETGMELETFIHGALCYCYSGQCLFSSFVGGRSGNRGRCAQPCRLPYEVLDEKGNKRFHKATVLSLKDLCTLEFLPEILETGVFSLKIEGRMKQASYAYTVVSIYRKYLDYYEKHGSKGYKVSPKDMEIILKAGNRDGFTDGYYHRHNGKDMITTGGGAHQSSDGVLDEEKLCAKKLIPISGKAVFKKNEEICLQVTCGDVSVTVSGAAAQEATSQGVTKEQIEKQLTKTGTTDFYFRNLDIECEDDLFIPVSALNKIRREAIGKLLEAMLLHREYQERKTEIPETNKKEETSNNGMCVNVLVRTIEQLEAVKEFSPLKRLYVEITSFNQKDSGEDKLLITYLKQLRDKGIEIYFALPYIFRKRNEEAFLEAYQRLSDYVDGVLARSYDGLSFAMKLSLPVVCDASIYTFHTASQAFLKEINIEQTTIPVELTRKEALPLLYNSSPWAEPELVIYGRIPMMISAGCVNLTTSGCTKKPEKLFLKDRKGYVFPVVNECAGCYNVIYNSLPTCLFKEKSRFDTSSLRLQFSVESKEEVAAVLSYFEQQVLGKTGTKGSISGFTWGHYKHGVE